MPGSVVPSPAVSTLTGPSTSWSPLITRRIARKPPASFLDAAEGGRPPSKADSEWRFLTFSKDDVKVKWPKPSPTSFVPQPPPKRSAADSVEEHTTPRAPRRSRRRQQLEHIQKRLGESLAKPSERVVSVSDSLPLRCFEGWSGVDAALPEEDPSWHTKNIPVLDESALRPALPVPKPVLSTTAPDTDPHTGRRGTLGRRRRLPSSGLLSAADPFQREMQQVLVGFQEEFVGEAAQPDDDDFVASLPAGAAVRLPSYQSLHPLEAVKLAGDLPPELCFLSVQLDLPDGQTAVLSVKTACAARPAMRTLRPARGSHMPSGLPLYGAQEMLKRSREAAASRTHSLMEQGTAEEEEVVSEDSADFMSEGSVDDTEYKEQLAQEAQQMLAELRERQSQAIALLGMKP